jgi:hypothetical protein
MLGWIESFLFRTIGNSDVWRNVCLPSSNGFFTANALGRMYGALANSGSPAAADGNQVGVSVDDSINQRIYSLTKNMHMTRIQVFNFLFILCVCVAALSMLCT